MQAPADPRFRFEPSDDWEVEDDQYVLLADESVTAQVCDYGGPVEYQVNVWHESEGAMYHHGLHRDPAAAFDEAAGLAKESTDVEG